MQVQRTEHLSAPFEEPLNALRQVVNRLRWQLAIERLASITLRALVGCAIALLALSILVWLAGVPDVVLWAAVAPLVLSIGVAVAGWPSHRDAAVVADRRLGLEERLATAVELMQGATRSRFSRLQVHDTLQHVESRPFVWLTVDDRSRVGALGALALILVALPTAWTVIHLPSPVAPAASDGASAPGSAADALAQMPLADNAASPVAEVAPPPTPPAPAADLARRVQQEQSERSALDGLAQALGSVSAGQSAATAIQQGDYPAARDQLRSLADQADQLSNAAKQQLATALQDAAASAQSDRALADQEHRTAQALSRGTYTDQRNALSALADQVQRSGTRSVPSEQLQRDMGQLQQQTGPSQSDEPPNSPGIGNGPNPDPFSSTPSRLDTAGQQVSVPQKLSNGAAVRPPDPGDSPSSTTSPSLAAKNVAEPSQTQQTGQLAPERNLVPGDQRPVIRGYFR